MNDQERKAIPCVKRYYPSEVLTDSCEMGSMDEHEELVLNLETMPDDRDAEKATKARGEPLAWVIQWGSVIPGCRGHREVVLKDPGTLDAVITPLYVEQPAPVVVGEICDLVIPKLGLTIMEDERILSTIQKHTGCTRAQAQSLIDSGEF